MRSRLLFVLLIFSLFQMSTITSSNVGPIRLNQTNYVISVSNASIIINYNISTSFSITVTESSLGVDNARFDFSDISLDIDESQNYISNGVYNVVITQRASRDIEPGNYSTNLLTIIGSDNVNTSVNMVVFNTDITAPVLNVINPEFGTGYNESLFYLVVEGTDENRWRSVSVELGSTVLLYIENLEDIIDRNNLFYNRTYVIIDQWLDLTGIQVESNALTISVTDVAFNKDSEVFMLAGDYQPPILSWISHESKDKIFNRTITLAWDIDEENEITSQTLFMNNALFLPNGEVIPPSATSITFFIPIPEDEAMTLLFKLVVTDNFDNQASIVLEIIYDSSAFADFGGLGGFSFDSAEQRENIRVGILLISSVIAIGVIIFFILPRIWNRKGVSTGYGGTVKIDSKKAETILNPSYYYFLLDGMIDDLDVIEKFNEKVGTILSKYQSGDTNLGAKIKLDISELIASLDITYEQFMQIEENMNGLLQ